MKLFPETTNLQLRHHRALYILLSFFIPALVIIAALAGLQITPFGDHSLIIADGNGLYLNFLAYVGRVTKGQEGILFSFEKGLGGNMMSSWGWFLLNPTFALFSFFDISNYPTAYTWVSLLNFSVCGITMYILLADTYGHKLSNLIFSTAYALNGFLVANVFQMNFFTGVQILPLMVLGLRKILNNKNPLLYILALAYSLLTNFYFGFMLCTASLLIFLVFFIADSPKIGNKKAVVFKYILSSLLAGALSAIVWLPALLSLKGGRLDQSVAYAITFKENMPFLEMASKFFSGANSTAELSNGLPNVFVGILPIFLILLFFINRMIDRRRKIAAGVLLAFYLISFYIPAFNIIMHGGTTTNWFNYRDSFVFCFLLLMIAAEEWQHIKSESVGHIVRTAVWLLLGTIVVFSKKYEYVSGGSILLDFSILALMYFAYWIQKRDPAKNPWRTFEMIVLLLMSLNLFVNYYFCTKSILKWETKNSEYQEVVIPVSILVDAVKGGDDGFYRMEIGKQRSGNLGNDSMLYGYNGVGHGGSDDRDFVRTALSQLGVHRFDMRNHYGKGVPAATDALLGLKYVVSRDDLSAEKSYEHVASFGNWSLYRNLDALPIAMIADGGISDVEIDYTDVFDNLNRVWAAISGETTQVFVEENDISFETHNTIDPQMLSHEAAAVIISSRDAGAESTSSDISSDSATVQDSNSDTNDNAPVEIEDGSLKTLPTNMNYIQYTLTSGKDGAVYCYNRSAMADNRGAMIPAMISDGYHQQGETVTGYLLITNGFATGYVLEDVAGRFRAAYADNDALHIASETVRARPCTIEKLKDSHLRGEFTVEDGQLLMFTIPYDEGWTCRIDGEKAELKQVLGVFMAVDAPAGTHSYEMQFFPTGMKTGIGLSAAALLTTLVYIPLDSRRRKRISADAPETASGSVCQAL